MRLAIRFLEEEAGQDLIEYGLLVGIVTAVSVATITAIGTKTKDFYTTLCTTIGATCP
jgi:pilus assembly protein Flp/PilA